MIEQDEEIAEIKKRIRKAEQQRENAAHAIVLAISRLQADHFQRSIRAESALQYVTFLQGCLLVVGLLHLLLTGLEWWLGFR